MKYKTHFFFIHETHIRKIKKNKIYTAKITSSFEISNTPNLQKTIDNNIFYRGTNYRESHKYGLFLSNYGIDIINGLEDLDYFHLDGTFKTSPKDVLQAFHLLTKKKKF